MLIVVSGSSTCGGEKPWMLRVAKNAPGMRKGLIPQGIRRDEEQRHQEGGRSADQDRIARNHAAERRRRRP